MAKHFTKEQIDEIRRQLATDAVRDTDFPETDSFHGEDYVAIVQDGRNKRLSCDTFRNELQNGPQGESTYEIAVRHGYTGTEEEWLAIPQSGQITLINHGTITNAPDEEDITSQDELLKLADRPSAYGLGYCILRRNKTFAEQVTKINTIYEIRYDFDLDGDSVTIPANCVLKFAGGTINNGTVTGNNTRIDNSTGKAFSDVTIAGTWEVDTAYPEWFGAVGDGVTDDRIAIQNAVNVASRVVMEKNYLVVNAPFDYTNYNPIPTNEQVYYKDVMAQRNALTSGDLTPISVGSNKTIVISGTVKAHSPLGILFELIGSNTTFTGGGMISGCGIVNTVNVYSGTPAYEVTNWEAALIYIQGSNNKVENLTLKDPTRQGVSIFDYLSKDNVICNCTIGGGLLAHTEATEDCSFTGLFGIYARGTNTIVRDNVFKKLDGKHVYDALYCNYTTDHVPAEETAASRGPHTTFEDNYVDGVFEHAIYSYAANLRVIGNRMKTVATTLQLFNKHQFVDGNTIIGTYRNSGIVVSGEHQIVTNNVLYNMDRYAIRCQGYHNGSCDYDYVANNYIEKYMEPFDSGDNKTPPAITFEMTSFEDNIVSLNEITCEGNKIVCMNESEDARTSPITGIIAVYADASNTIKKINILNNTVLNSNVANNIGVTLLNGTRDCDVNIVGNTCVNTYPIIHFTPYDPVLYVRGAKNLVVRDNRLEQLGTYNNVENAGSVFKVENTDRAIFSGNRMKAQMYNNRLFYSVTGTTYFNIDGSNLIFDRPTEQIVTIPGGTTSGTSVYMTLPEEKWYIEIIPINDAAREAEADNPLKILRSYMHSVQLAHDVATEEDTIYKVRAYYIA